MTHLVIEFHHQRGYRVACDLRWAGFGPTEDGSVLLARVTCQPCLKRRGIR